MARAHQASRRGLGSLLVALSILGLAAVGWIYRQNISDWYRLRSYSPSQTVVGLADQTAMTDEGRRIFYTTHPEISDETTFNTQCRQGTASEYSIVLGCYVSNGGLYGDMYLFNVTDERLAGVMQVTAAHEMLHAAYDRLSTDERADVDAQLIAAYKALPEGRIKETIAQYEAADPASVPSELHSILGTELRELPPGLEKYYRRYFSDRLVIVGFSEAYEQEFTRRQQQVEQYDAQLAGLKETVDRNQAAVDEEYQALQRSRDTLDSLEASSDISAFNARVSGYNQQVARYNELVQTLRQQIEEYNRLVEVRNGLAAEFQALADAIDSRPQTL